MLININDTEKSEQFLKMFSSILLENGDYYALQSVASMLRECTDINRRVPYKLAIDLNELK